MIKLDGVVVIVVHCSVCPNMSLTALDGETCHDGEIVIRQSSNVRFNCMYGNNPSETTYTWKRDGETLSFNLATVSIDIPAGVHTVQCQALINESPDCQCDDSQTITVTVIGTKHDYIIIRQDFAAH